MTRNILTFMAIISLLSCKPSKELHTVKEVDINRYCGKWYEIAKLPNRFQKGLECATATYTVKGNGKIEVFNQAYISDNKAKMKNIKGTAWVPDANYPGRLKVRFFWPFSGDYYIMALDKQYSHVLVGAPSRKYLWILSRTKHLEDSTYNRLLEVANVNGFDVSKVVKDHQDCN